MASVTTIPRTLLCLDCSVLHNLTLTDFLNNNIFGKREIACRIQHIVMIFLQAPFISSSLCGKMRLILQEFYLFFTYLDEITSYMPPFLTYTCVPLIYTCWMLRTFLWQSWKFVRRKIIVDRKFYLINCIAQFKV